MYTRKQALAIARQVRTCPPREIKDNPAYLTEYERHLEQCPFCSTDLCLDAEAWLTLSDSASQTFQEDKEIASGQIRQIRPDESRWQDSLYFNSPFIIVMETARKADGTVLVVQIWHDIYLGAPGDILVPGHLLDGPDELIIEPWNTYRVKPESLGMIIGRVEEPVIEAVIRMVTDPDDFPPWANQFVPIKKHDPRIYFRQLERKVANVFSASLDSTVKILCSQVSDLIKGVSWTWEPGNFEECLGTIQFPDEYLPLSASPAGTEEIVGVLYRFEKQRLASVSPVRFPLYTEEILDGEYSLTGKVPDMLNRINGLKIQCYLENVAEERLFKGEWIRDAAENHYLIRFRKDKEPLECVRIVVCDGAFF